MGAIGDMLRRERLKAGWELGQIAQQTKIPTRLLQAIECEEFEKLPGRVFAISFVRQYAHALGLDEEQVIADLRAQQEPPPPPAVPQPAEPAKAPRRPGSLTIGAVAGAILLLVVGYAVWLGFRAPQMPVGAQEAAAAAVPARGSADRSAPSERPGTQSAPPAIPAGTVRVTVTTATATWLSAKLNGQTGFSGTLQPNETKELDGAESVKLVVGNAGMVEISVNGKAIGPIGPRGHVGEVLITAPDRVQILPHHPALQDIY